MTNGPLVQAKSWESLEQFFADERTEPLLHLVQLIRHSPASTELYGATSHWTLLVSNEPAFDLFGNALHVIFDPHSETLFFQHRVNPGPEDSRICPVVEGAATLKLFLKYKYGVLLT